jgi:F-type H+-transporting ATPase subunit b
MFAEPEFWVAVAFAAFVGIVVYYRVPKRVTAALDARSAAIAKEIEEAQRLREEAQALLASYQRKQRDAEKEVEDIVSEARAEAERLAGETKKALEAQLIRRTKLAEDKIARAEAEALSDVRALAAEVAVGAARRLIEERLDEKKSRALLDGAIKEIKGKLN